MKKIVWDILFLPGTILMKAIFFFLKKTGAILDSAGKIVHREPPDKITLIQGKKKKNLEQLF